jgi:hypothetical protein
MDGSTPETGFLLDIFFFVGLVNLDCIPTLLELMMQNLTKELVVDGEVHFKSALVNVIVPQPYLRERI